MLTTACFKSSPNPVPCFWEWGAWPDWFPPSWEKVSLMSAGTLLVSQLKCPLPSFTELGRIREKTDSRTWNTLCSKRQNMDTEQWGELSCKEKATKVNDVKAGGRNSGGSLYFRVISFHYPPVFWHIAVLFPMFKVFRKLLLLYSPAPPRMDKI